MYMLLLFDIRFEKRPKVPLTREVGRKLKVFNLVKLSLQNGSGNMHVDCTFCRCTSFEFCVVGLDLGETGDALRRGLLLFRRSRLHTTQGMNSFNTNVWTSYNKKGMNSFNTNVWTS